MEMGSLALIDPEIYEVVQKEEERQRSRLELIASENFVSNAVREAQGSVLTNKYAEGYPGRRYYGGCEFVDAAEILAIERAKQLFGAEYANVQPHSGSQANMAVYFALLNPGDVIMGMDLSQGGHLTHGSPVSFSGRLYKVVSYGVNPDTEIIDYDALKKLAFQYKPRVIIAGASAYPRIIDFEAFRSVCDLIGSFLVVDMAHIAGLVSAGFHPNPVPYADVVTSTTHKTLRGPRGGLILSHKKYAKLLNSQLFPGIQGGPLMHVIAAKAVAFKEAMSPEFKDYQRRILENSETLAEALMGRGYRLVSGGTDNHLILIDLKNKGITGKEAEETLDRAGITVNKNTIPFDTQKPGITSGIRIGTPAVTTRGMGTSEMNLIAEFIDEAITYRDNIERLDIIRQKVKELCGAYPLHKSINGREE